jgi:LmbE family N-acetylglucosaminyl deacetylase
MAQKKTGNKLGLRKSTHAPGTASVQKKSFSDVIAIIPISSAKKAIPVTPKVTSPKAKVSHKSIKTSITSPPEPLSRLGKLVRTSWFPKIYVFFTLLVLFSSTAFWALLSARVHSGNADQLVNPFLFDNSATFHGSLLPGQHTFLLKWPIFLLTKILGNTTTSYVAITVAISLVTVGALAYVLHRIERRSFVKGTLFLALASVLFVIPAQPYPGGLLPVNMAMIATRNLEYVLYIACVWGIIRSARFRSVTWALSVLGLVLLISSDKLFLTLSLGASITACVLYALRKRWALSGMSARWFTTTAVAAVGSFATLSAFNALHITHISAQGSGPYGLIHTVGQAAHALLYSLLGLLTNFGANPAYDTAVVRDIPHRAINHLFSLGGMSVITNGLILFGGLVASYQLMLKSIRTRNKSTKDFAMSSSQKLALILLWTTIISFAAFIFTDHYYTVDARYLTISLFAVFITIASYVRTKKWEAKRLVTIGMIIVIGMGLAIPMVVRSYHAERTASTTADSRNKLIVQAIGSHSVDVLVGDYWRVVPIRQISHSTTTIMPLTDCITPRGVLSSASWQPNLQNRSFAYILSLDKSQTDYPVCSATTVFTAYGKPNASIVIDGTLDNPKELLLFYDHGSHKSAPQNAATTLTSPTVEPISIENLPSDVCSLPSSLNIVAHQDDDLLFMNPDVQLDIDAGHCVRTIYITAGDAGSNQYFWLGREQGSEAAYSKMIGSDTVWIQRIVKLADNRYISVANPKGNSKISLIFMRLPDGNLQGQGFAASKHASLQKLLQNKILHIDSIYGDSRYTASELATTLSELMRVYQPTEIRTLANFAGSRYPDHSDHMAVSRLTDEAYKQYEESQYNNLVTIPIKHYIGYPVHERSDNVSDQELQEKTAVFLSYAKHDATVCQSIQQCTNTPTYGSYLRRQYTE